MSTIETILTRAMSEADFAEQLLTTPHVALAAYKLTTQKTAFFEKLAIAEFTALAPENRKSMAVSRQKELLILTLSG